MHNYPDQTKLVKQIKPSLLKTDKKRNPYDPKIKYVFSLNSLLSNHDVTLEKMSDALKKRGFTFVRLPDTLVKLIDHVQNIVEKFFTRDKRFKDMFYKEPIFGYFDVKHKESFRILTGKRIDEQVYPLEFKSVIDLVKLMDRLMYKISLIFAPYLFPNIQNIQNMTKKYHIPLFNDENPWGMFDVTQYHNDGKRKEMNCKEHADPGLLSMHLRSTEPGLQLKDEYGNWYSPKNDKNIGIIWAGHIANKINPKIKPGFHRVINPINVKKPRFAMWYEICTEEQEHKDLIYKPESDKKSYESETGIPTSKSM